MMHKFRVGASLMVIAMGAMPLASCVSPTYGTDKTAAEQLLDDLGESVSVGSTRPGNDLEYQPRPGLVVPSSEQLALVEPQSSLAGRENNPNWVESPEEIRKRLLEESEGEEVGRVRSPLAKQLSTNRRLAVAEQRQSYEDQRQAQFGLTNGKRRYLSDPPASYRTVEDPTVLSDLGESETAKERRRKKEAKLATKGGSQWWDPLDLF